MRTELFKKQYLPHVFDAVFALMLFLLPLSSALPNIVLGLAAVLMFFIYKKNQIETKYIGLFVLAIFYLSVLALIKGNLIADLNFYGRLGIALVLMLGLPQVRHLKYAEHAFITGVGLAVGIAVVNVLRLQGLSGALDVFGNTALVNDVLRIERPYFGFLLALVTFLSLRSRKLPYLIIAVVATLFCAIIAARLALGLIVIVWLFKIYRSLHVFKKWRIPAVIGFVLVSGVVLYNNETLKNRFKVKGEISESLQRVLDYEPRYVIWPCTFTTLQTTGESIFGLDGIDQFQERLVSCYANTIQDNPSKKAFYLSERFNPHNQFLQLLCLGGIIALLLVLSAFMIVFFSRLNTDVRLLALLFFLFFLLEVVLYRQLGCYLFGLFLGVLAKKRHIKPIY